LYELVRALEPLIVPGVIALVALGTIAYAIGNPFPWLWQHRVWMLPIAAILLVAAGLIFTSLGNKVAGLLKGGPATQTTPPRSGNPLGDDAGARDIAPPSTTLTPPSELSAFDAVWEFLSALAYVALLVLVIVVVVVGLGLLVRWLWSLVPGRTAAASGGSWWPTAIAASAIALSVLLLASSHRWMPGLTEHFTQPRWEGWEVAVGVVLATLIFLWVVSATTVAHSLGRGVLAIVGVIALVGLLSVGQNHDLSASWSRLTAGTCNGKEKPYQFDDNWQTIQPSDAPCAGDLYYPQQHVQLWVKTKFNSNPQGPYNWGEKMPRDVIAIRSEGKILTATLALVPRRYAD